MRITPLDVRKQEFRKAVRGFDCDEVRAFLATLADEYETVLIDNKQLRERLVEQEDKVGEYKSMERTLRDTLMTAEKLMQESKGTAQREGDVIIQAAHQKARSILEECRIRTEELRREIVGLRKEKETYLARFKGLAEAQIAFIETHRNDFADLDKRLVDLVDSVVEGTLNSEAEAGLRGARHTVRQPAAPVYGPSPRPETASASPAPASRPEVDMWRDYIPAAAVQTPPTNHETLINQVVAETAAPAVSGQAGAPADPALNAAAVEMAAMGIPVPAVPLDQADLESDAIAEAISATLSEDPRLQPHAQG